MHILKTIKGNINIKYILKYYIEKYFIELLVQRLNLNLKFIKYNQIVTPLSFPHFLTTRKIYSTFWAK